MTRPDDDTHEMYLMVNTMNEVVLLDYAGVAELLTVSERTVRRMVARGELIPPFLVGMRRRRWLKSAVLEAITRRASA